MKITPFQRVGNYNFDETFDSLMLKVKEYTQVYATPKLELFDKTYPAIFIQDINLHAVFNEDKVGIRYFEIEDNVFFQEINLHTASLKKLEKLFKTQDPNFTKSEIEGIEIPLYGIRVNKQDEGKNNCVFIHNKDYLNEYKPSEEEIMKFYLGTS